MKVLIVSAFPPEHFAEANHALHYSEQLAKSGHLVHVLCKKGSIAATQHGIVVHPVIQDWSWSDLPKVVKCIRECRPDVVLLLYIGFVYHHNPMITFLPTICKTLLNGIPCVTQFANPDEVFAVQPFAGRVLRNAMTLWAGRRDIHQAWGTLLRDSNRIIALSSPHRARLMKHYPEVEEKSVIIPPPPLIRVCADRPATVRQQVRAAIGAAESDFVLIYWGYIYRGKGVETLLQAFRIVCRRNDNVRLVLVGGSLAIPDYSGSDYVQMLRQLLEQPDISDKVTWTGHFNWDSDEGSRYLYAGDACILPFDYGVTLNNSSLAAASTHGVPVIGTEPPVGQDEALEHGKNIYLCRSRDPEMLAEAIQLMSENAGLRERLRLGTLALARDWHRWETTMERLVGVLESAVSGDKAARRGSSHPCGDRTASLKTNGELPGVHGHNERPGTTVWSEEDASDNLPAPLVSIIVAARNVATYLSQCLDSLVNQTLKNIEIIVVNDASTDNTPEIIHDYKARYPNLQVVNCESNLGTASVRNLGLRVAKGQYIAFTDADDWADIRMCEVMYRRAREDNSDVVIVNATVFYEDSKSFGHLFDQPIRDTLDPRLRTMPFELRSEPRILLLESVNWTKLYKRSFLQKHALTFEEGMNSYEDISFHFNVLMKATGISLVEDTLYFYRKNRPGQVTARTNRQNFETFDVFHTIRENLTASDATADIWAMLVKVQVRIFGWLLQERVQARHKREFLASVAQRFQRIPEDGFRSFARQADSDELAKLFCMRRNWLYAYEQVARRRWPLFPLLNVLLHEPWHGVLKRGVKHGWGMLRRRVISVVRSLVNTSFRLEGVEKTFRTVDDRLKQLTQALALQCSEPLVETCRINDQMLFLSRPDNPGIGDATWRMQNDFYLTQTAVFRDGDTVIDVGAHVGVVSIYLAKKYPFIKVYAIEPDPLNYACLRRNIELNGVTNVTAINKAVSGDGERRRLYTNARDSAWATIDARVASSHRLLRTAQVDTVTLEQLFQEYEIWHCRLLKITAPGAIQEALEGFTRSGCVDLLCGEVDLEDCSRAKLEMASWRIARQHFWRTLARHPHGTVYSWIHQLPPEIERLPSTTDPSPVRLYAACSTRNGE